MSRDDRRRVNKYQEEDDNAGAEDASDAGAEADGGEADDMADDAEVVVVEDDEEAADTAEAEVVGEVPSGPAQADRVEDAKTYQITENGVTYQIQPRVLSGGRTRWTIVAFLPSVQGPVFQGRHISDEAADDLGLSRSTQDRLNTLVERANERLGLPSSLRGEERERAPLGELADALDGDDGDGDEE